MFVLNSKATDGGAEIGVVLLLFIGWIIGTLEVYVCLHFMGYPIDFAQALMIESLAQAVRGAAFAVPPRWPMPG